MIPGGEGRLPRRIPLSERTGATPAAPHDENDAFRLPRAKGSDLFRPAPPPTEDSEG